MNPFLFFGSMQRGPWFYPKQYSTDFVKSKEAKKPFPNVSRENRGELFGV